MIRFWRMNERTVDNLGLACTEDGLFLGRTPLIERRGQRFVVREDGEIERLLKRAYQTEPPVKRLMHGLATVAAALNADDQCLARIAAVHLQMPDLPGEAARRGMEAEDVLIKSGDWNPALHLRTASCRIRVGLRRPMAGLRSRRRCDLRRTMIGREPPTLCRARSRDEPHCRPASASTNLAIFWSGSPMQSPKRRRR